MEGVLSGLTWHGEHCIVNSGAVWANALINII